MATVVCCRLWSKTDGSSCTGKRVGGGGWNLSGWVMGQLCMRPMMINLLAFENKLHLGRLLIVHQCYCLHVWRGRAPSIRRELCVTVLYLCWGVNSVLTRCQVHRWWMLHTWKKVNDLWIAELTAAQWVGFDDWMVFCRQRTLVSSVISHSLNYTLRSHGQLV